MPKFIFSDVMTGVFMQPPPPLSPNVQILASKATMMSYTITLSGDC